MTENERPRLLLVAGMGCLLSITLLCHVCLHNFSNIKPMLAEIQLPPGVVTPFTIYNSGTLTCILARPLLCVALCFQLLDDFSLLLLLLANITDINS